ncbi:MAG: hypothetical protein ABEJ77_04185 [Halanaeroarchaeum sp.]
MSANETPGAVESGDQSTDAGSQLIAGAGAAVTGLTLLAGAYSLLRGEYLTAGTLVLFLVSGLLLYDIGRRS